MTVTVKKNILNYQVKICLKLWLGCHHTHALVEIFFSWAIFSMASMAELWLPGNREIIL
jgi:hypothetical protein